MTRIATRIIRRSAMGFRTAPLYRRRAFPLWQYISHKFAFWTALLSLLAFAGGNLVGQHGVNAVLTAAFGAVDERMISYAGIVPPVRVPDYARWQREGGVPQGFTYEQVPSGVLRDLPLYDPERQNSGEMASVYSVGYMGSYAHGGHGDGGHPGVDIRAPHGTPVVSAMDGLVVTATEDGGSFGKLIVIKTLNAPDPQNPARAVTLYAGYAHLSSLAVSEGDVVKKGQLIGRVGATGFATGNHLHFQIDRSYQVNGQEGPHPLWPFTWSEAQQAGLSFMGAVDAGLGRTFAFTHTISPLEYVQAGNPPLARAIAQERTDAAQTELTPEQRRNARIQARRDRVASREPIATVAAQPTDTITQNAEPAPQVLGNTAVVSADPAATAAPSRDAASVVFQTQDGTFPLRQWRPVRLTFLDADGREISSPRLKGDLYLRTAFGSAQIKPDRISELDIQNGQVRIQVLGLSPTVLITVQPLGIMSPPLRYEQR